MTRVPLNQGAYTARSVIANAQRAVNIYPETNAPTGVSSPYGVIGESAEMTHYNAPGLNALGAAPNAAARCLYLANNGTLYYLAGPTLYTISASWILRSIGTIGTEAGIASMGDNGTTLLLVDGSGTGYQVDLSSNAFSAVSEATNAPPSTGGGVYAFYGADRIDVIDGYFVLNQPNTRNFYSSYENEAVFDALYFAAKNGYSDDLVTLIVSRRQIWLLGQKTTEIWYNAGDPNFPFEILPGPFIQHGCAAKYSVAQIDGAIFWLSQDQAGTNILVRGEGATVARISTHALEQEWATYPTTADAQGFCFQFGGHRFYQINFPTANRSWRWDESTKLWHEPVYIDANGNENRHRVACAIFAYGLNVGADWETGQLYSIDPDAYTDNGAPMYFRRGFPHMMQDGRQAIYPGFVLDVEAATIAASPPALSPLVYLRWSDDRGRTWSNPVAQSLGKTGQYLTQPKWNRLGRARDRVFEAYGVIPGRLAINGAFLDPEPIKIGN